MEEDEHDHGLGFNFHGLELILGWAYRFSCGYKSVGKFTGLEEEDDRRVSPWLVGSKIRALFFSFWHNDPFSYIIFSLYLINN